MCRGQTVKIHIRTRGVDPSGDHIARVTSQKNRTDIDRSLENIIRPIDGRLRGRSCVCRT